MNILTDKTNFIKKLSKAPLFLKISKTEYLFCPFKFHFKRKQDFLYFNDKVVGDNKFTYCSKQFTLKKDKTN